MIPCVAQNHLSSQFLLFQTFITQVPSPILFSPLFFILARLKRKAPYFKEKWGCQLRLPLSSCSHFLTSKYSHSCINILPWKCTAQISCCIKQNPWGLQLLPLGVHPFIGLRPHCPYAAPQPGSEHGRDTDRPIPMRHRTSLTRDFDTHRHSIVLAKTSLELCQRWDTSCLILLSSPFFHRCQISIEVWKLSLLSLAPYPSQMFSPVTLTHPITSWCLLLGEPKLTYLSQNEVFPFTCTTAQDLAPSVTCLVSFIFPHCSSFP